MANPLDLLKEAHQPWGTDSVVGQGRVLKPKSDVPGKFDGNLIIAAWPKWCTCQMRHERRG
eukprot:5379294-Amphidinium_carterae.1